MSERELEVFARRLAAQCHTGDVILLRGELGVGKSSFARAFIRSLMGGEVEVPSPTFALVQAYDRPEFPIFHYDLYRVERLEELLELALDESVEQGVCLIEWPDIALFRLPESRLEITLEYADDTDQRYITCKGCSEWRSRLPPLSFP